HRRPRPRRLWPLAHSRGTGPAWFAARGDRTGARRMRGGLGRAAARSLAAALRCAPAGSEGTRSPGALPRLPGIFDGADFAAVARLKLRRALRRVGGSMERDPPYA